MRLLERFNSQKNERPQNRRKIAAMLAVTGVLAGSQLYGATSSWIGNDSTSWSDSLNWSAVPGGNPVLFGAAGSAGTILLEDIPNLSLPSLTFNASAPSYTFNAGSGASLAFSGTAPTITTSAATTDTIIVPISFGGTLSVTGATVGGVGSTIVFSNAISDGSSAGLFKALGPAGTTITLGTSNSFTGGVFAQGGVILRPTVAGALGSISGTLTLNYSGTLDLDGTNQTVGNLTGTQGAIENNGTGLSVLTIGGGNTGGGIFSSASIVDHGTSGTGTLGISKVGTGSIEISAAATYTGGTTVTGGTLSLALSGNDVKNFLTIGNGADPATVVTITTANQFNGALTVNVNANGLLSLGGLLETANQVNVGGTVDMGGGSFAAIHTGTTPGEVTLNGGTIKNGTFTASDALGGSITVTGNTTSLISSSLILSGNTPTFNVANGTAPIDFQISGQITSGNIGYIKTGTGVLMISGATSNNYNAATTINAGTVLIDTTSGSGTGQGTVTVNAGATLGGTGTIGGVSNYTKANVVVVGTSGNLATLAPGDIDATTGGHVPGSLTVGSAAQNNSVSFNGFSLLAIQVGPGNTNDELLTVGTLSLTGTANGTTLAISSSTGTTAPGTYTVATFSTLVGSFNALTIDGVSSPTSAITYDHTADDIAVTVTPEPTSAAALIGGLLVLSRRRRRSLVHVQSAHC